MKKQDRTKVREKLEQELKEFRKLSRVHRGGRQWLREVREALGMSVTELAYRLDCSRKLVYRIEEGERDGEDRIDVMQRVAEAMDCRLIYAIVPENGKTLEETAEWLKENPEWRTERQEARKRRELDALSERLNREHCERVQKQKEERARAQQRLADVEKVAEEWAAEKEQRAAEGSGGYGPSPEWKPPAEWWTAQTAESMKKQNMPGDWALRMALFQAEKKAGQGVGGTK